MLTYEDIKNNEAIRTYIQRADESLVALGFTEHSFAHVTRVAETAGYILETLGYPARTVELVKMGTQATVQPVLGEGTALILEKSAGELTQSVTLAESVDAPVAVGDPLGTMTVTAGEQGVAEIPILAGEEVPRVTYGQMLLRLLRTAFFSD